VLLLDEPAGNLDPRARIEMRELLQGAPPDGQDDPDQLAHPARAAGPV
jgi:ABC-type molybdenum transport system ATPase subunit/photorepair protein PhrA